MVSFLIGFGVSALVAWVAYRKDALSESGVLGAVLVGTMIYGFGGAIWFSLLLTFFISGSCLSHIQPEKKQQVVVEFAKTGKRDFWQALANGGLGGLLAALSGRCLPRSMAFIMFIGVMATVNADTWATEVGVLSKKSPRSIITWREVPRGTSGGISLLGTSAAAVGALLIGVVAQMGLLFVGQSSLITLAASLIGGLAGCFIDSLLGATYQVIYRCPVCGAETEKQLHCGKPTVYLRGLKWLNNDAVNLLASASGGFVAALINRI